MKKLAILIKTVKLFCLEYYTLIFLALIVLIESMFIDTLSLKEVVFHCSCMIIMSMLAVMSQILVAIREKHRVSVILSSTIESITSDEDE